MKTHGMKYICFLSIALSLILSGCRTAGSNQILEVLQENLAVGNISMVIQISDSLKNNKDESKETLNIADSLARIAERIALDFSVSEDELNSRLEKLNGTVSEKDRSDWENKGWLEFRILDGEKKYFNRAASNLLLIKNFQERKNGRMGEAESDPEMYFRLDHTKTILEESAGQNKPVVSVGMNITYTLTVEPDAVPEGEIIRCWLPWPRSGCPRQQDIKLLSTSNPEYSISPDSSVHSTIYMEETARKGMPAVFQITYNYVSYGQHFDISKIKILPYNKFTSDYQKYTSEQLPHICFTDRVRQLADSITQNEEDPAAVVRKIYSWFKENITWTGALEYSIIPNIPQYAVQNMRGDCGIQTFLFLSMLRYKGIPARWQSGWMMPPQHENLHDWAEVYYEGTGWVPADVSYDLQYSEDISLKEFYLSGIDSYRLIVNEGVAGPLHPEKLYLRSEPYDFQRGEVEWSGGNLYFDKWEYDMKIRYYTQH